MSHPLPSATGADADAVDPAFAQALAALHGRCFAGPHRPWSAAEFAALLDSHACFLLGDGAGFAIGRSIADEAELLTLAVAPEARRQGRGRALLEAFRATARARGAARAFLEVAADNLPALALYHADGWTGAGRRRGYYAPGLDALVLCRDLGPAPKGG